jgi:ABC-type sugar transport system permease subunit
VFAPTVVPLVAAAMIWLWLFNSDHGLINRAARLVGVCRAQLAAGREAGRWRR